VNASIFHVRAGNVPVFTVGRFHHSGLYLNYTPHDPFTTTFDLGGAFGPTAFRLGSFKTTAVPTADPDSPQRWAFLNSEIAAGTIGTVTLSGLKTDNGGVAFGIKVQSPGAVVKVTRSDNLPPNSVLAASDFPIEGDFFFIDE
jgi:hypothetical protein